MTMKRKRPLATVNRLEDIPSFSSQDEEHAFWSTHELSDHVWEQGQPLKPGELPPPRPGTTAVVIHLDEPTLRRLNALARRRRRAYQELLGELVREQLEHEERKRRRLAGGSSAR